MPWCGVGWDSRGNTWAQGLCGNQGPLRNVPLFLSALLKRVWPQGLSSRQDYVGQPSTGQPPALPPAGPAGAGPMPLRESGPAAESADWWDGAYIKKVICAWRNESHIVFSLSCCAAIFFILSLIKRLTAAVWAALYSLVTSYAVCFIAFLNY